MLGRTSSFRPRGWVPFYAANTPTGTHVGNTAWVRPARSGVSVRYRDGWETRWRDASGRQRPRRFHLEDAAPSAWRSQRKRQSGSRGRSGADLALVL